MYVYKNLGGILMATKPKAKKIKFASNKEFLFVGELGIQFRGGKYETSDEKEIEYLSKLEDVEIVAK